MELTEEPLARIRKYLPRSRGNVQRDDRTAWNGMLHRMATDGRRALACSLSGSSD